MTREEAFIEINKTQDEYIDELIGLINSPEYEVMKAINFTSPTGTGKTKMMSKLINRFPDYYFIITTLSKGQLHLQVKDSLLKDCNQANFYVYGSADYKINSKLQAEDIINQIPKDAKCIWLRDEGHIATNRYDELLLDVCYKVINFSATNNQSDIQCNFAHTMMLRTVNQNIGTPEDAIKKLLEVKEIHKNILNYNPCAIFRCVGSDINLYNTIVDLCIQNQLKYIDVTEEKSDIIPCLCEDDNKYDVIINKFKIVEGIDIRRAHILYMDNQPKNNATTIQIIGRCRRNALLYRNDIDILAPENEKLLKQTRECFVFYNVEEMNIDEDENGELQYAFCKYISCEELKPNTTIEATNGQLKNGLYVLELKEQTGNFEIKVDDNTGFNVINPITDFYELKKDYSKKYLYFKYNKKILKLDIKNISNFPIFDKERNFDWSLGKNCWIKSDKYYVIAPTLNDFGEFLNYFDNCISFDEFQKEISSNKLLNIYKIFNNSYLKESVLSSLKVIIKNKLSVIDDIEFKKNILNLQESYRVRQNKELSPTEKAIFRHKDDLFINTIKYYMLVKKEEKYSNEWIWKQFDKYIFLLIRHYGTLNIGSRIPNISAFILIPFVFSENGLIEYIKENKGINKIEFPTYDQNIIDYLKKIPNEKNIINDYLSDLNSFVLDLSILKTIALNPLILNHNNNIKESYFDLFIEVADDELEYISKKSSSVILHTFPFKCSVDGFKKYLESNYYEKVINDKESSIIGTDLMQQIKDDNGKIIWVESKSVSSKIGRYTKLNTFITTKYCKELEQAKPQCFSGKNNFNFDKRCNSVIGYCVEYYSKYLIWGDSFLGEYIKQAQKESKTKILNELIIVRACMLKYREVMMKCFGSNVAKIVKTISINQLIQLKYRDFVNVVVELGKKTADYVKHTLYFDNDTYINPDLSICHITGLADYLTKDTILDVKVRNTIDDKCVRQVLAYHYLSTKRSDLNINRVIVYDATSDKSVVIDISKENQINNFKED